MRIMTLLISCFLLFSIHTSAQKTDKRLQKELLQMTNGFKGDIGWCIIDLKHQKGSFYNADSIFPTASIVKVPILAGIMQQIESGALQYHQKLTYKDSLLYEGEDILGSFKNNETIDLSKVIMLMLTTSDNTASLWLQSLAGTGTAINTLMEKLGLVYTRVNSRTPGRENDRTVYGWGQTTPREMATLFAMIVNRQVLSQQTSATMLKLLSRNYWDEESLSTIPAGVFVASKNGAVNASRSEVLYVNGKKTPYIFAVFTKNNQDVSWEKNNEAWQLTRRMSTYVWQYYNGK